MVSELGVSDHVTSIGTDPDRARTPSRRARDADGRARTGAHVRDRGRGIHGHARRRARRGRLWRAVVERPNTSSEARAKNFVKGAPRLTRSSQSFSGRGDRNDTPRATHVHRPQWPTSAGVWTARIRDASVPNEPRCASAVPNPSPHPPTRACSLDAPPNTRVPSPASHDSAGPGPAASIQDEKERIRITALQRRKLQRFEDIVDDLEDLVTDGGPTSRELEDRQGTIDAFREDIWRLNASFAGGAPSVFRRRSPWA